MEGTPPRAFMRDGEGPLLLLDQTRLPEEEVVVRLDGAEAVAEAIRALRVRGAPAIGVVAAHGLALAAAAQASGAGDPDAWEGRVFAASDLLRSTRPTGVNLAYCLDRMGEVLRASRGLDPVERVRCLNDEAFRLEAEDVEMCRAIGAAGLGLIPPGGAVVLTHCNAGALATAGMGTALAPVYAARQAGIPVEVVACETRPVLQGSRLTAWELQRAGIPVTVVPDGAAGAAMAAGRVGLVIVGADRIAANGDTANKIGTYALAVLAAAHGIPFHVAAPRSTLDGAAPDGRSIPIEERDPDEVRRGMGRLTAPATVPVWNPAFDVTPAHLITSFITDAGLLRPPFGPALRRLGETSPGRGAVVPPPSGNRP